MLCLEGLCKTDQNLRQLLAELGSDPDIPCIHVSSVTLSQLAVHPSSCFLYSVIIILLNEKRDGTERDSACVRTERSPCGTEWGHSCLCHSDECAPRSCLLSFSKAATWVAPSCHSTTRSENIGTVANTSTVSAYTAVCERCGRHLVCVRHCRNCGQARTSYLVVILPIILSSDDCLCVSAPTVMLRDLTGKRWVFLICSFDWIIFCPSLFYPGTVTSKKSPNYCHDDV